MTRKDYIRLAAALREAHERSRPEQSNLVAAYILGVNAAVFEIGDVLAADNPRFDRERFYSACCDNVAH
jgi:hypothetical protein